MIRQTLAPRSFHIGTRIGSFPDCLHFILHFLSNAFRTSRYPIWSPAQYLKRVCMTSSSKGRRRSRTYSRASGGSMAWRAANKLVHSAEVWLKRRRRARHDKRRCQSYKLICNWIYDSCPVRSGNSPRGWVSDLLDRMKQVGLEPSSLRLANYWSSRSNTRVESNRYFLSLTILHDQGTLKDSRQEYENRFLAIRQLDLEQVVFQVEIYICWEA